MVTSFDTSSAVLILPDKSTKSEGQILKLKHPKNSQTCLTHLSLESNLLSELFYQKEKFVSWFVDNNVLGDTQLCIGTPLDPIFMIIPYLVNNSNKYSPLAQILVDDKYPSAILLEDLVSESELSHVADVKPSLDKIVKFNKEKTLNWLLGKVNKVTSAMKKSGISPGFNSSLSDEEFKKYACGIVSDYICSSLSEDLQEKVGVKLYVNDEAERPAKRPKLSSAQDHDSCKPAKNSVPKGKEKAPKMTKAQKQLATVNTKGMKSMSSFFKKVEPK
jgi:ribonuclease H2 subunit B